MDCPSRAALPARRDRSTLRQAPRTDNSNRLSARVCTTEPEAQDQFLRGQARGQRQVGIERLAAALSIAPLASGVFRLRRSFSAAEVVGIQKIVRLSLATLELRGTGQVQGTEHSTNRFDPRMLTPNRSSERFYYVLSQWIGTGPSDLIEQGGDAQSSRRAVYARKLIFYSPVGIVQLED